VLLPNVTSLLPRHLTSVPRENLILKASGRLACGLYQQAEISLRLTAVVQATAATVKDLFEIQFRLYFLESAPGCSPRGEQDEVHPPIE